MNQERAVKWHEGMMEQAKQRWPEINDRTRVVVLSRYLTRVGMANTNAYPATIEEIAVDPDQQMGYGPETNTLVFWPAAFDPLDK